MLLVDPLSVRVFVSLQFSAAKVPKLEELLSRGHFETLRHFTIIFQCDTFVYDFIARKEVDHVFELFFILRVKKQLLPLFFF